MGILSLFRTQKKKKASNSKTTSARDGSSASESGTNNAIEQIRLFNCERDSVSGDEESSSSELGASDDPEDLESLNLEDIIHASEEDEGDHYTTLGCKESLTKFRVIAKKLRYSPNSKTKFIEICRNKGCPTPHTVERDVCTQWNFTYIQLRSIIRCKDA
ncbi:hypothetical protein KEM48_012132, partial [Puccinia striiformis f. sp. tritici PST-130]